MKHYVIKSFIVTKYYETYINNVMHIYSKGEVYTVAKFTSPLSETSTYQSFKCNEDGTTILNKKYLINFVEKQILLQDKVIIPLKYS